ncbi:hypothetical protein AB0K14_31315 [Actinosynnema sp. NPDC050801]|uniref:hypothetical protein n=1 Tax=unclassified Actinosynnema TaxID=2637065 RepID=UPI0034032AAF
MWISESHARHVHAACGSTGRLFAVVSVALAAATVVLGLRLPIAYHFFGPVVWIIGGASALNVLYAALGLSGVRSYIQGGYLDVNGARRTRRLLAAMWVTSIVFSSFACLLLLATVAAEADNPRHPDVRFTVGVWAYLCLLASPPVLTGVLFFVGRRLLVPAPPAVRQDSAVTPTGFTAYPPPPPQRQVWISAARAHEVRVACGRLGTVLLTAGVLPAPAIVLIGGRLPPIYPALGSLSWTFAAFGVVQVFVAATVLRGGRRYVTGEHLDVDGALTTRKSLGVVWGLGLGSAVISGAGLSLGLSLSGGPAEQVVHHPVLVGAVLSLMATPALLTGVAYFVGRRLFTPPAPAG